MYAYLQKVNPWGRIQLTPNLWELVAEASLFWTEPTCTNTKRDLLKKITSR